MPTLLRELYLTVLFVAGAGAMLAPFFVELPAFSYLTAKSGAVGMPKSVVIYAVFLLVAIAALAKRLMNRTPEPKENDAQ